MLTYHLVVLLIKAGDVVLSVLEAGDLTNSAGTTTHHLLISGDESPQVDTRDDATVLANYALMTTMY